MTDDATTQMPGSPDGPPTGPMPSPAPPARPANPPAQVASELWEMVRDYAKQETIGSFSAIGKYLAWGLAGSLLLGIGVIFLTLAGLRALQTQTGDTFTGKLTWLPYFIVIAGLAIVGFLVWTIRGKKKADAR